MGFLIRTKLSQFWLHIFGQENMICWGGQNHVKLFWGRPYACMILFLCIGTILLHLLVFILAVDGWSCQYAWKIVEAQVMTWSHVSTLHNHLADWIMISCGIMMPRLKIFAELIGVKRIWASGDDFCRANLHFKTTRHFLWNTADLKLLQRMSTQMHSLDASNASYEKHAAATLFPNSGMNATPCGDCNELWSTIPRYIEVEGQHHIWWKYASFSFVDAEATP